MLQPPPIGPPSNHFKGLRPRGTSARKGQHHAECRNKEHYTTSATISITVPDSQCAYSRWNHWMLFRSSHRLCDVTTSPGGRHATPRHQACILRHPPCVCWNAVRHPSFAWDFFGDRMDGRAPHVYME